ncbi:MAG: DUF58 domain-containing protein [Candidatus Saccharibacteria bacterium]|nr:DUF58 domain-containing protein [Candidatus Saccharibacteria bacterium]
MTVNVMTFPDIVHAERQIFQYDSDHELGRFSFGDQESPKIGDGLEIDGLRDYVPGDDARHIDWLASAKRPDGGLFVRQHYADQVPLTVLISDIPTEKRYSNTPGNPLSAQSLGFVVCYSALKSAVNIGSPLFGAWTDGYISDYKPRGLEGPKAPEIIINAGIESATRSAELNLKAQESAKKVGLLRKKATPFIMPEDETLADLIDRTAKQAKLITDAARFIIVSDFRAGTDDAVQALSEIGRRSDVITVQITNPLLRELPASASVFQGEKQGVIIESEQQRVLYAQKAAIKQARIDELLKQVSVKTVKIDTMDPKIARVA